MENKEMKDFILRGKPDALMAFAALMGLSTHSKPCEVFPYLGSFNVVSKEDLIPSGRITPDEVVFNLPKDWDIATEYAIQYFNLKTINRRT